MPLPFLLKGAVKGVKAIAGKAARAAAQRAAQKARAAAQAAANRARETARAMAQNAKQQARYKATRAMTNVSNRAYSTMRDFVSPSSGYYPRPSYNMGYKPMRVMSSRAGDDGAITIKFREFIQNIGSDGTSNPSLYTYYVNPALANKSAIALTVVTGSGNPTLSGGTGIFSWLPGVASSFQQFRINNLCFEYVSTSGNVTTSQSLGTINMGIQYDAIETGFYNTQTILNSEGSISGVPYKNHAVHFEHDKLNSTIENLYVLDSNKLLVNPPTNDVVVGGNNPSILVNGDPRLYYPAIFSLEVTGVPPSSDERPVVLGQLWADYEITLIRPRVPPPN